MTINKKSLLAVGVGALLLFSAPAMHLLAHEDGKDAPEVGEPAGPHKGMMKDLDLTDAQKKQMKELNQGNKAANKAMMEKVKLDMDTLRVLVDKKASDSELTAQLDKLKADRKAMTDAMDKHIEAMRAILTPMQQAKFAVSMGGHMGDRMEGKGGPHGKWGKDKGDEKDDDHGDDKDDK